MRICIIGSGLTSLTLAKALVNKNIHVDILKDKKKQSIDQSRTIGIAKSNVEYFNNNIVNIDKIIWKLNKIEILSDKLNKEKLLEFQNNNQELFSMVRSFDLYNILEKSLKKNKFFKIHNKINLENIHNKYNLLINLNFTNLIAKKFFSKKIIKKYKSLAYTLILEHEKIDNKIARQVFTKIGPLAFLPISDKETSVVYSIKNTAKIKNENLIELISLHNPKYKIKKIKKISSFELLSASLRNYYYKNILAFGELTHKIHPLAGQGFNMTIRDIKTLLEIIQNKIDLGLQLNISVNQEFQKNIRHRNFIFSNGIDFIYEFFNYESKTKNNFLLNSLKYIGNKNFINNMLKRIADNGLNY
ncbi:ubiquinone biosynthesis protein UbiB [Candidatus Pelagibacter sp. HIMB1748]|uniref:ubiquinone biosynthesis protein UbiB n=1 Tax=unclassified Candidatus Pelagibacter TaxID=2647897 RepID=UPI003F8375AB